MTDSSSLQVTDDQAKAVQKTSNRVTLQRIIGSIHSEYYVTLDEAIGASFAVKAADLKPLSIMTVCVLVFKNGFVQIGYSAPADPENFNAELGIKFARENAIREAWPKFGFALCEEMFQRALDGL